MIYCPDCGGETTPNRVHYRTAISRRFRVCLACAAKLPYTGEPQCECGRPKKRRAKSCEPCAVMDAERIRGETRRRVVAALTQWDWCAADDFWGMLSVDHNERKAIYTMLERLTDEGVIERKGNAPRCEYRLVRARRAA